MRCQRIKPIGVWRLLERVNKQREGIKLFIAVAGASRRVRKRLELDPTGDKASIPPQILRILVERRIAHEVTDRALLNHSGVVEIAPVSEADQVRYLHGMKEAASRAMIDSRGNGFQRLNQFRERQLIHPGFKTELKPRHIERRTQNHTHAFKERILLPALTREFLKLERGRRTDRKVSLSTFGDGTIRHEA